LSALEDERQTELVRHAWNDSGKAYWYHNIHDELIELG